MFLKGTAITMALGALALTSLLSMPSTAQTDAASWDPLEQHQGCTFWNLYFTTDTPATWSGTCVNGHIHGQGVLTLKDASQSARFEGTFIDGKLQGAGKYENSEGYTYEGEMKGGKAHGYGITFSPKNYRYEGEFKNGLIEGNGVFIADDKVRYEGEMKNGLANGYGIFEILGSKTYKYEGEFKDGEQHGYGIISFHNGSSHEGEFRDDERHGYGIATRANGNRCEGEWRKDKFIGTGIGWVEGQQKKCTIEGRKFIFTD